MVARFIPGNGSLAELKDPLAENLITDFIGQAWLEQPRAMFLLTHGSNLGPQHDELSYSK